MTGIPVSAMTSVRAMPNGIFKGMVRAFWLTSRVILNLLMNA